jgi:hypothetical protein
MAGVFFTGRDRAEGVLVWTIGEDFAAERQMETTCIDAEIRGALVSIKAIFIVIAASRDVRVFTTVVSAEVFGAWISVFAVGVFCTATVDTREDTA